MKNDIVKIIRLGLVAAILAAMPATGRAADATNAPAATMPKVKKNGVSFHGKVTAVDTNAMTLTIATQTFNLTSETRVTKDGRPATLSEISVGESVRGTFKTDAAGKLTATAINAGAKKKKADSAN
jgi:hypothetical protein